MRKLAIAFALIGALFVSGCETISVSPSPTQLQTARIATKLGVQIGVLQYVGEDAARAERVRNGAKTVKALLDDDTTVSLFEVQTVVNELIDTFVAEAQTPQQVLLLKNAVTLVVADIELLVPTGVLDVAAKERVNFYLDAVIEAVSLVAGPELASNETMIIIKSVGIDRMAALMPVERVIRPLPRPDTHKMKTALAGGESGDKSYQLAYVGRLGTQTGVPGEMAFGGDGVAAIKLGSDKSWSSETII